MALIWVALLMATGVMFGMSALVVDTGYGMDQVRAMQNGADAGAMAAAKLLAGSVGNGNPITYVVSDNQVHQRALEFTSYNRPAGLPGASYPIAVEYLLWNGVTTSCAQASPRIFTANSDTGLVSQVGGTRNTTAPSQLGSVPTGTCGVRVLARVTHSALFASTMGLTTETETASAAARVYPAPLPTVFSDVWPITRWLGATGCTFTLNAPPCTFWDSQGPPNGSFKLLVDLSRYSQLALGKKPPITRQQHIVDWDHTYPGNSGSKQTDLTNWITNGWHGQLNVSDARCANANPSPLSFSNCTNSRLEIGFNGTLGSNMGDAMRAFIDAHYEGVDTSSKNLGRYVTMHVFLWRYGESNLNPTTDLATTLWTSGSSSSINRIILEQVRCFRFYRTTVSNSDAQGYYVSCPSNSPPSNGPPSTLANSVGLVD